MALGFIICRDDVIWENYLRSASVTILRVPWIRVASRDAACEYTVKHQLPRCTTRNPMNSRSSKDLGHKELIEHWCSEIAMSITIHRLVSHVKTPTTR
ncbi:unnamed protein product [Cylicocyclus nassatus]|uniref:Uncharacterized protein n=1 Tax=Cylicocyclus nassatus TaxID=53992 RepID=A0AA36M659_CYLNA|nr:unnamed protein product [Cylicocyclus nassatus]